MRKFSIKVSIKFSIMAATAALTLGLTTTASAAEPTLAWSDILTGDAGLLDDGFCALTDPEGHLVIAGESADLGGGTDMYVRKLSRADKSLMWDARYEAFDGNDMAVSDMCYDAFGNIIVGGFIRGCAG